MADELAGAPVATRVEANATPALKARLAKLSAADLKLEELAGERVLPSTRRPGTAHRSVASRPLPRAAGLPRVLRAPRISTRFML
ncbi:MAG: hypothetical protein ABI633_05245 [Burkholderiales bacterium]